MQVTAGLKMFPRGCCSAGAGAVQCDNCLVLLSCLFKHGAQPRHRRLIDLSRSAPSFDRLESCFLDAVASASNPFIPGMILSVALADAVRRAPEGERRKLLSLQNSLESLLLEVLERLPHTVQGFPGRMDGCSAVFEPENTLQSPRSWPGPLKRAMGARHQLVTFCTTPLLVDFLSRRFTKGLPNLWNTKHVELEHLVGGGAGGGDNSLLVDNHCGYMRRLLGKCREENGTREAHVLLGKSEMLESVLNPRLLLQGAQPGVPSLTFLSGAQFVTAGVVAKPRSYYAVPALRMTWDLFTYLAMLVLLTQEMFTHEDAALTRGETIFAFYVVVRVDV